MKAVLGSYTLYTASALGDPDKGRYVFLLVVATVRGVNFGVISSCTSTRLAFGCKSHNSVSEEYFRNHMYLGGTSGKTSALFFCVRHLQLVAF